jgi:hypothetical protein
MLRDPLGSLLASKTGTAAGTLALDDRLHGDLTGSVKRHDRRSLGYR